MKIIKIFAASMAALLMALSSHAQKIPVALDRFNKGDAEVAREILDINLKIGSKSARVLRGFLFTPNGDASNEAHQKAYLGKLQTGVGKGDADAMFALGYLYRFGAGNAKFDPIEAFGLFSKAAPKGSHAAAVNLYEMYTEGVYVPKDVELGTYWLKRASDGGSEAAQSVLAYALVESNIMEKDFASSLQLNQNLAAKKNAWGYQGLGWAYRIGRGVNVDHKKAFEWFSLGAEMNDASSLCGLGQSYRDGKGVTRDDVRAADLFKRAARLMNGCGLEEYASFMQTGRGGVVKNEGAAVALYLKGAEMGRQWSQYALGNVLRDGRGVPKDEVESAYWFLKASEQSHSNATRELAKVEERVLQLAKRRLESEKMAMLAQASKLTSPRGTANSAQTERLESLSTPTVMAKRRALLNARADAKALAKELEAVGYKVSLFGDLNEKDMKQALRTFKSQTEGGDEVLIFYAGHGVQLGGANYLLPVDVRGEDEEQLKDEGIQLQRLLDDMNDRKAKLTVAVIDACRDNPFQTKGRAVGGRGLAPTTAATGQMILFSAGAGQQALDKLGKGDKDPNSVFTRTFIKEMGKQGLTVDRVLRNVRNQVVDLAKSVGHNQVPALYDQVVGEFYFKK